MRGDKLCVLSRDILALRVRKSLKCDADMIGTSLDKQFLFLGEHLCISTFAAAGFFF